MQRRSIETKTEYASPKPKKDSGWREIARRVLRNPVVGPMLLATAIGLGSVQKSEAQDTAPTEPAPALESAVAGGRGANLRAGMSTGAEVLQTVPAGAELVVQDVDDPTGSAYDWVRVISIGGDPVEGDIFVAREVLNDIAPVMEPAPEVPENEVEAQPTEAAEGYVPTTEAPPTAVLEPTATAIDWSEREMEISELRSGQEAHEGVYGQDEAQVLLIGRVLGLHQGGGHMPDDESIWYMELTVDGQRMFMALGSEEAEATVPISELSQIGAGENAIYRAGSDHHAYNLPLADFLQFFRENTNMPIVLGSSPSNRIDEPGLQEAIDSLIATGESKRVERAYILQNADLLELQGIIFEVPEGTYLTDTSALNGLVIPSLKMYLPIQDPTETS